MLTSSTTVASAASHHIIQRRIALLLESVLIPTFHQHICTSSPVPSGQCPNHAMPLGMVPDLRQHLGRKVLATIVLLSSLCQR